MKGNIIGSLILLLVGAAIGMAFLSKCSRDHIGSDSTGSLVTDTTTVYDTIQVYMPVPRDSVVVRYVTQVLPMAAADSVGVEKAEEEITVTPASGDSVSVRVPITQKLYETDAYRAYVSGYQPTLDSLFLLQPTQVIRIREKPKRWGVGVQVGYGFTPHGAQPYIGVGLSYNLFRF